MGGCIGGWLDGWVNMWVNGGSFLDIFYLNHLSPLWGYFLTLSQRIKAHLLLMYCIKNLSIGVS